MAWRFTSPSISLCREVFDLIDNVNRIHCTSKTGVIAGGWELSFAPKFQTLMRNVMANFGVERNV